jgi:hypothetical protein
VPVKFQLFDDSGAPIDNAHATISTLMVGNGDRRDFSGGSIHGRSKQR